MSVRVIAGTAKGRRLKVPDLEGLRPTTGRLRQVLFDIIGDAVVGARVLDCFAGSGALGIEALSRGAASAIFVESERLAVRAIEENLAACGFRAEVVRGDFEQVVGTLEAASVDLALVDPPYSAGLSSLVAALEGLAEVLAKGATVAIEASPGLVLPSGYLERKRRRAGSTELVFATT